MQLELLVCFGNWGTRENDAELWSLRKWAERVKTPHHLLTQTPLYYFLNNKIKAASLPSQGGKLLFPIFAQHIEGHLCLRDAISIWVMNDKKGRETGGAYSSMKKTKHYVLHLISCPPLTKLLQKTSQYMAHRICTGWPKSHWNTGANNSV